MDRACSTRRTQPLQGGAAATETRKKSVCRAADPALMQDFIVGSAVTAAVGSALFNGLKKEQVELCDLCQGMGGARCFVCEGSGKNMSVTKESLAASGQRRFGNPRECKPCRGSGLIPCSKCKGTGYLNGL